LATVKEEAVILRAYDLGEADRILVLLTPGSGIIRAVAKGIRRTKSKFGGRLEPFNRVKVVLHRGRNLHTVTGAEVLDPHPGIREDFWRYLFGEAILEAVERGVEEGQVIPRLYTALCISLKAMESGPPLPLTAAFLLKFCALVGYRPHLGRCLHCGERPEGSSVALDLEEGGIVCERCLKSEGGRGRLPLMTFGVITRAEWLLGQELRRIDREEAEDQECLSLAVDFAERFLGKRLRAARIALNQARQGKEGAPDDMGREYTAPGKINGKDY